MYDSEVFEYLKSIGFTKIVLTKDRSLHQKDLGNGIVYTFFCSLYQSNKELEHRLGVAVSFEILSDNPNNKAAYYNAMFSPDDGKVIGFNEEDLKQSYTYQAKKLIELLEKYFPDIQTSFNTFYDKVFPIHKYTHDIGYFTLAIVGLVSGDDRWREIADIFLSKSEAYIEHPFTKPRREFLKKCLNNPPEYKQYIPQMHKEIEIEQNEGITTKTKKDLLAQIESIPKIVKDRIKELLKEYISSKDFTELYKSIEDQRDKLGRIKGDLTVYNIDQIRNIIEVLYMLNEDEDLDVDKLRNKWGMEIFEDDDELADAIGYGDLE